MQTILPKQALDKIAQKFGFPEFVLGESNDDGLIFELMWIGCRHVSFYDLKSSTVVIHSNQWIKIWSIRTSGYILNEADITQTGDSVLSYIDEGHSFGSPMVLDGYSISFRIFTQDKTRSVSISDPDTEFDATSVELENRLNQLSKLLYGTLSRSWLSKLHKMIFETIVNFRYSDDEPLQIIRDKISTFERKIYQTDYIVLKKILDFFSHNGSFHDLLSDDPIEYVLRCSINDLGLENDNHSLSYDSSLKYGNSSSGRVYFFMKTKKRLLGYKGHRIVVPLQTATLDDIELVNTEINREDFNGFRINLLHIYKYQTYEYRIYLDPEQEEIVPTFWNQLSTWIDILHK